MSLKAWTLLLAVAANSYLLGVMLVFAWVLYPMLGALDRAALPAPYALFNARIGLPVVAMEFAALLTTLALYAWRPDGVALWAVHVLTALGLVYFGITFGFHLPAHRALAAGDNSEPAMQALLVSHWARTAVHLARTSVLAWLGARSVLG